MSGWVRFDYEVVLWYDFYINQGSKIQASSRPRRPKNK